MTFVKFLQSKQRFIIIWLVVHGMALFVNLFNIEGETAPNNEKYNEVRKDGSYPGNYEVLIYRNANILTTAPSNNYGEKGNSAYFWPFVKFYESKKIVNSQDYHNFYEFRNKKFNGIFYRYDFSEFIAYTVLLLLVFYFMWSGRKTSAKS